MRFTASILLVAAAAVVADAKLNSLKVDSTQGKNLLDKARKLADGDSSNYNSNYESYMANVRGYYNGASASSMNNAYGYNGGNYQYGNGGNNGQNWNENGGQNMEGGAEDRDWGNNYQDSYDTSWMTGYSIKFDGCAAENSNLYEGQPATLLAKFKLCPDSSGKRCRHGGEYVTTMADYIEAFEGIVMTDENCRMQQETCYNQCQENARYSQAYENDNEDGAGRKLSNYGQYGSNYGNAYGGNYQNNGNNQNNNQNNNNGNNQNNNNQNNNNQNNNNGNDAQEEQGGEDGDDANYGQNVDYNNYYDEQYCRYDCMTDAGMAYCEDNVKENGANGYQDLDISQMVQCHQLRYYSADSKPIYVGATCKNGGVYLGAFSDSACTQAAPKGTHEEAMGYSLPDQNLVNSDLISCNSYKNSNFADYSNFEDYNQYQDYASEQAENTIGVCQDLYADAGKCEKKMIKDGKNTGGCDYIKSMKASNGWFKALRILAGIALAVALVLGCYFGYTRRGGKHLVDTNTFVAMIQRRATGKSLNEPLAPDSGSVTSSDSEGKSTVYQGAKMAVGTPPPPPPPVPVQAPAARETTPATVASTAPSTMTQATAAPTDAEAPHADAEAPAEDGKAGDV